MLKKKAWQDPPIVRFCLWKWNANFYKERRSVNGYSTESYEKIQAKSTIAWAHPKWGNLRVERVKNVIVIYWIKNKHHSYI